MSARSKAAGKRRRSSSAESLATLVGMPAERFLTEFWPHRPLVHHGPYARFSHLVEAPELQSAEALLRAAAAPGAADSVRVWFYERSKRFHTLNVDAQQAVALYNGGHVTAVVDNFRTPTLRRWMERLALELETPMATFGINTYASTNSTGTKYHFDQCEVILLQVRGEKTWRIAPNAVPNVGVEAFEGMARPLALLDFPPRALEPDKSRATTHVLRPGSIMFLPRGYWHESDTTGTESLALTLTFNAMTWAKVLGHYLIHHLTRDPVWRETAHGAAPLDGRPGRNDAHFRRLMQVAAEHVSRLERTEAVQAASGVYSVVPPLRLRVAKGVRATGTPPTLRHRPRRGAPVAIALDASTGEIWSAIARQTGVFMPADITRPHVPHVALGRFIEALLKAGVLERADDEPPRAKPRRRSSRE